MKKIITALILPLLMACGGGTPVDQIKTEVHFESISLEEGITRAKTENKYVFVEFYMSWCGTCQELFKIVFADAEVGKYLNENYINLKIDLEKGEGPDLKSRFDVKGFPTTIILDGGGNEVKRHQGKISKDEFLSFVKK